MPAVVEEEVVSIRMATVVTGAGRGLGRAMVLALVKAGKIASIAADLADPKSAAAIVQFAEKTSGPVSSLVNCAGIGQEIISPKFATEPVKFWTVGEETWKLIFAVNTDAVFRLCVAVTPGMIARGWGRIVNVTTSLETMIRPGMSWRPRT